MRSILLLLAMLSSSAAELEHFYLIDGRSLIGEYDSATGILSVVTASGKILIPVALADIAARKPANGDDVPAAVIKPPSKDIPTGKPSHRTRGEILADYDECQSTIDKAEKRSVEFKNPDKNGVEGEAGHWAQDIIGRGGDDLLFETTYISRQSSIPFEDLAKTVLFANAIAPGHEISILVGASDAVAISGTISFGTVRDLEGNRGKILDTPVQVTALLLGFNRGKRTSIDEAVASAKRISDSMLTKIAEGNDAHRATQADYDSALVC